MKDIQEVPRSDITRIVDLNELTHEMLASDEGARIVTEAAQRLDIGEFALRRVLALEIDAMETLLQEAVEIAGG